MKKHLSVLMLFARCTIYKVLGILVLMCGLEFLLFNRAMAKAQSEGLPGLEYVVEKSWINIIFFIALLGSYLLLSSVGSSKKIKYSYTLNRLRITENWIFFWQGLYNALCFALLLFVQIAAAVLLCHYYVENSGDATITHQTIFLAFYRNTFLHSLLPFDEAYSVAASVILLLILGLTSALIPMLERHGRGHGIWLYFAWLCTIYAFRRDVGAFGINMMIYILTFIIIAYTIYFLLTKEARHDN